MQYANETTAAVVNRTAPVGRHSFRPKDLSLLRSIRDATWITRQQLEALPESEVGREEYHNRNRRLARLLSLGQIEVLPQSFPYPGRVFGVTRAGIRTLELVGHGLMTITSDSERVSNQRQIAHYLGLNMIRIHMAQLADLTAWLGDRQLASLNAAANSPVAKDYDAICEIKSGPQRRLVRVGIEYEKNLKSKERYAAIRKMLATETQIRAVIYFVDHVGAAISLGTQIYSPSVVVLFVVLHELANLREQTPVRLLNSSRQLVVGELGPVISSL